MNLNRPATAWLFIVQAECRDLFDRLAPRLSGMARVILDSSIGAKPRVGGAGSRPSQWSAASAIGAGR